MKTVFYFIEFILLFLVVFINRKNANMRLKMYVK